MPGVTLEIKFGSPLHDRILKGVRERVQASRTKYSNIHAKWKEAEERTIAYLPEREIDASRRATREAGKPTYTTIQIPYSYAVLMASHTYWTTVFMSRAPVLQFTGRHGESQQQIQAVEAMIDYQVQVGQMLVPWYIWLLDAGKYGAGVVGQYWTEESSIVSSITEEEEKLLGVLPTGRMKRIKRTQKVPGYVGNKVYNVKPYYFFPDPRVPLYRFQEGEFCAVYVELGWNTMLRREDQGLYTNIQEARKHSTGGTREEGGSDQFVVPEASDYESDGSEGKEGLQAGRVVPAYECHIELVPDAWGLGTGKMPEKWVFTVTKDYKVVLGAQPLGAYHNKFQFQVLEFEPEGYALVNRGIPEILKPVQNTMDWLINSHFYNVRKVLNDQFIVDPSRVVMKDFNNPLPGKAIRLKPEAYGTDVRTAVTQLQVNDVTRANVGDLEMMFNIGQRVIGVSEQMLGAMQQGGRKTAAEIRTSSTFGISRLKTISEYFSAMGWAPMSQMLVQNSQQYYDMERKFRIVGDLALEAGQNFVTVDPEAIQGFFDFVPVDGTLPVDRFAQANLWQQLFGQMRNFPQVMQTYDMGRIFAWVAQLSGLKNINQFKVQVVPDALAAAQGQQGNTVPIRANAQEPGQIPNLGPTG